VANLPYNIASTLVVSLLEQPLGFSTMVCTLQREVAERMAARPGGKAYGPLSVAVQFRAEVAVVGRVPAGAFFPPPDVESAVVRLDARSRPACPVEDAAAFFRVVRAAFGQRRKTLRNALAGGLHLAEASAEAACGRAQIDPRRRGETLTLAEFAALADALAPALRGAGAQRAGGGG
jgi:16S rRNA (adenine1518-N6/adenine1519-N6)-dimethyltransferase